MPNKKLVVLPEFKKHIKLGEQEYNWRSDRYYQTVNHTGLQLQRRITGTRDTLQQKLDELVRSWSKKYAAQLAREANTQGKDLASQLTADAQAKIFSMENLLNHTLDINDEVDWETLKNRQAYKKADFPKPSPEMSEISKKPSLKKPTRPKQPKYSKPEVTLFQRLTGRRGAIEDEHLDAHNKLIQKINDDWELQLAGWEAKRAKQLSKWKEGVARLSKQNDDIQKRWLSEKREWDDEQEAKKQTFDKVKRLENQSLVELKKAWQNGEEEAVLEHACLVLDQSDYPDWLHCSYIVQFDPDTRLLKVEYKLPSKDVVKIPKTVRFVQTTGELTETPISNKAQKDLYDSICYQVALRTVHELYEADSCKNVEEILFNGVVEYVDPSTGAEVSATIMSAIFNREKFLALSLDKIEPKSCFKSFNGVAATSLIGMAAIPPVMHMDTEDRRFVDERAVDADALSGQNLAAMDWEEFEHLVREVFQREFSARGGEVKVTQSSSDGGVDAVAFDPDPISGGKIVIQAKRYTKTVGVSAVRDLYGTTMNEGASKGILVTTADFGPDAYKFVAGKPITLLNGGNLLHLLSKHGMNATINLKQARKELGLD